MKFLQNMKEKKANNKGFSLVELIIVIAIMAILVGIVGTQVIPYLNKSKESKDLQLLNSYSTAAVTAYSSNADKIYTTNDTLTVTMTTTTPTAFAGTKSTSTAEDQKILAYEIAGLAGYENVSDVKAKMSSTDGQKIDSIAIIYNFKTTDETVSGVECPAQSVTVIAYDAAAPGASSGNQILDVVVSYL